MDHTPNRSGRYAIGVDLGGTNIRAALTDLDGTILKEARRETPSSQPGPATVEMVTEAVEEVIKGQGLRKEEVVGIGMGVPGMMDSDTGLVYWSPNFPEWKGSPEGEPIGGGVAQASGLATFIVNDARCAALGELRFGAGRGAGSMVMITLGTGIGGGIVYDGKIMLGPRGSIGEVGHQTIDPNGPKCGCGNFGCMEALCNKAAIIDRCLRKIQAGRPTMITSLVDGDWAEINPEIIDRAADSGDALAREVMEETGMWIGIGVANLISLLGPELFVIGGGVAQAGETIFEPIRRTVAARAIDQQAKYCRIVPAELGDAAGVKGGVALLLNRLSPST